MTIRESLQKVLTEYPAAKEATFAAHPLAEFLRQGFPEVLRRKANYPVEYLFKGSPGRGNWAKCPWVACLNVRVTRTAESGFYVVYLFQQNFRGIYLSLNQGITKIRKSYKEGPKALLRRRAADFRTKIGVVPARFPEIGIDLAIRSSSELGAFYESGNICAVYYDASILRTN